MSKFDLPVQIHATATKTSSSWWSIGRAIAGDLLLVCGLFLALLLGTTLGYRARLQYALALDSEVGVLVEGLGDYEGGANGEWHRWSAPSMRVQFPGVGVTSYRLMLRFHNPVIDNSRTIRLEAGERALSRFVMRPGWQELQVNVPRSAIDPQSGDLDLTLHSEPPFQAGGRELGIALRELRLEQVSAARVPWRVQRELGWGLLLVFLLLRLSGVQRRWSGFIAGALLAVSLVLIPWTRIDLLLVLPVVVSCLGWSLLAAPLLRFWSHRQALTVRPWAIGVAVTATATFVVRFVGMRHPQFVIIDHILRVHQIEAIAAGQRSMVQASLSQQYEWGRDIAIPYSLLSYDMFVPLVRLLPGALLLPVVEGVTAAMDASVVLVLWSLARRSHLDVWSSWWAAVLFAVFPVGYLYFHDGSYPTIIALWVTVVTLRVLVEVMERPQRWLWVAGSIAVALSILMYVTHLVFVPLLLGCAVMSAAVVGTGGIQRRSYAIALIGAAGFMIAMLGYYGAHLPELVTNTIPSYLEALTQRGSVGRDPALLPGPLLGNTWQQLWGHYRVIGVMLAACGVCIALRHRERWFSHLLVGYALFLALTAFVDLRFGLWNKHMYFALPGVCLAAGIALSGLQQRGRAGTLLAWMLFGYLLWTSLGAWLLRVIWYVWSLQTL